MVDLKRDDLWSLEQYSTQRLQFRRDVMAHKKQRYVVIGEHARLCFEDETTIRYQIQEMLRIERIFEAAYIQEELDTYNPLIPSGQNLKATFMLEYDDIDERKIMLHNLKGVEKKMWIQVGDHPRIVPISDEDLERENEEKTSSVHFMRFEFSSADIAALRAGEPLNMGIDSEFICPNKVRVEDPTRANLMADFAA
jgi:hypothetical protein